MISWIFFTGESPCSAKFVIDTKSGVTKEITEAYTSWVHKDMALLSLLLPLYQMMIWSM